MWQDWMTGRRDWGSGQISPEEVLYYLNGPAIFTCRIGLAKYLFFKSDEYDTGDYYISAPVTDREVSALKEGRLSVRGALSQARVWLLQTDFDLNVLRYEERPAAEVRRLLPKSGVPLLSKFGPAPDSLSQVDALFAFKFYGNELSDEGMPFSTFKDLVDNVYTIVRNALTPKSLAGGRDRRFMDFPVRQPEFASLLIAIGGPTLDVARLRARKTTQYLDPAIVVQEAQARGRDFASQIEQTVSLAEGGSLSEQFAKDNFLFLQQIIDILPGSDVDISMLQFSSTSGGNRVFVEVDATVGDRIRDSFRTVGGRDVSVTGTVTGLIGKSKTFRLDSDSGREVTCQLGWDQFDTLVEQDKLRYGARVQVKGRYTKRDYRDWLKVEGDPVFLDE